MASLADILPVTPYQISKDRLYEQASCQWSDKGVFEWSINQDERTTTVDCCLDPYSTDFSLSPVEPSIPGRDKMQRLDTAFSLISQPTCVRLMTFGSYKSSSFCKTAMTTNFHDPIDFSNLLGQPAGHPSKRQRHSVGAATRLQFLTASGACFISKNMSQAFNGSKRMLSGGLSRCYFCHADFLGQDSDACHHCCSNTGGELSQDQRRYLV